MDTTKFKVANGSGEVGGNTSNKKKTRLIKM